MYLNTLSHYCTVLLYYCMHIHYSNTQYCSRFVETISHLELTRVGVDYTVHFISWPFAFAPPMPTSGQKGREGCSAFKHDHADIVGVITDHEIAETMKQAAKLM